MKESQLRALIETEIRSMLTEKFASKNMTKAFKRLDSYDKKMFNALSNKYKIAWDVIDDPAVRHIKNPSSIKGAPDTLVLWFTNSNKLTGSKNDWDTLEVNKGLLAVTHGKQSLSLGANVVKAAKPGKANQSGTSGDSSKYFNSFKRIAAFADEAYVVYYGTATSRNKVGNVQITRAQQKSGALALNTTKEVLRDNKRRYESKLKAIAAKLGVEGASKFMDKIYALFESEIKKKTDLLKKGTWDTSWTTGYQTARRTFEDATDTYQRLLEEIAAHKKRKGDEWEDKWFESTKANKIKEIKEQYLKLKKELDSHKPRLNTSESVNEKSLSTVAKDAAKFKKELSKLKKQHKSHPGDKSIEARMDAKEEQLRRVAKVIRNMRAGKVEESVNEGAIQDIEARLASAKKGAKASGGGYSGWVKTGRNSWKNKKTGSNAHNRALASQLGGFSDFKIIEGKLTEAKPDLVSMMRMAVTATKKSKQSSSTTKAYLKSLAKDLAKNAKDYVDYDQDDWVEDLENWIADRG